MLYRVRKYPVFFAGLILPAAVVVGFLILYPVINGIVLSFTDASPLRPELPRFVGLANYEYLLEDEVYYASVINTSYIVFVSSALAVIMGFVCALLLHFGVKRFAPLFRALVFQVWVFPWICITILWGWLFNSDYGLINYMLTASGITETNLDILFHETGAQWVMIAGFTWRSIPFLMVIALAGLQSISTEILEASELDGARFVNRIGHVILPLIRNVLMVALLLDSVRFFQEMTLPLLLTQGGADQRHHGAEPVHLSVGIRELGLRIGLRSGNNLVAVPHHRRLDHPAIRHEEGAREVSRTPRSLVSYRNINAMAAYTIAISAFRVSPAPDLLAGGHLVQAARKPVRRSAGDVAARVHVRQLCESVRHSLESACFRTA